MKTYSIRKFMGYGKIILYKKFIVINVYIRKEESSNKQHNFVSLKEWEKEEQTKSKKRKKKKTKLKAVIK